MISSAVSIQYTDVTDRRTDRHVATAKTALYSRRRTGKTATGCMRACVSHIRVQFYILCSCCCVDWQVKIWFQNRRSKMKKITKYVGGGGSAAAHSTITDADCSVSGTDELASSDDDDEPPQDFDQQRHEQQPTESRDSAKVTATPPCDQCISPPSSLAAQHTGYLPQSNLPPSQIPPSSSSTSSSYFMSAMVPDWTDLPPPPPPPHLPVGVIPPAYPDYFYPSNAGVAMAGYHTSPATAGVGVPSCPSPAGPYHHWYATGPSQHSLLA